MQQGPSGAGIRGNGVAAGGGPSEILIDFAPPSIVAEPTNAPAFRFTKLTVAPAARRLPPPHPAIGNEKLKTPQRPEKGSVGGPENLHRGKPFCNFAPRQGPSKHVGSGWDRRPRTTRVLDPATSLPERDRRPRSDNYQHREPLPHRQSRGHRRVSIPSVGSSVIDDGHGSVLQTASGRACKNGARCQEQDLTTEFIGPLYCAVPPDHERSVVALGKLTVAVHGKEALEHDLLRRRMRTRPSVPMSSAAGSR